MINRALVMVDRVLSLSEIMTSVTSSTLIVEMKRRKVINITIKSIKIAKDLKKWS